MMMIIIIIIKSLFILETIKAEACKISDDTYTTHTHAYTMQLE